MGYCVNLDIADFFFGAYWHKIGKKHIMFWWTYAVKADWYSEAN